MTEDVITFRCDKSVADKAKDKFSDSIVKFPDLLRIAVGAISDGNTTMFNDILRENELGASGGINSAWLYYMCHSLFEYRDGQLYAKRNKGSRNTGEVVDLRTIEGVSSVKINGHYYPVREIIWLMFYGYVTGKVTSVKEGSNRISDLEIEGGEGLNKIIFHKISSYEAEHIKNAKQRALLINEDAVSREAKAALIRLHKSGCAFYIRICDETGWRTTRTAIYAQKLGETYIVSIS